MAHVASVSSVDKVDMLGVLEGDDGDEDEEDALSEDGVRLSARLPKPAWLGKSASASRLRSRPCQHLYCVSSTFIIANLFGWRCNADTSSWPSSHRRLNQYAISPFPAVLNPSYLYRPLARPNRSTSRSNRSATAQGLVTPAAAATRSGVAELLQCRVSARAAQAPRWSSRARSEAQETRRTPERHHAVDITYGARLPRAASPPASSAGHFHLCGPDGSLTYEHLARGARDRGRGDSPAGRGCVPRSLSSLALSQLPAGLFKSPPFCVLSSRRLAISRTGIGSALHLHSLYASGVWTLSGPGRRRTNTARPPRPATQG